MSATAKAIDERTLEEFMHRFVGDLGAAMSAALVVIGDRRGLRCGSSANGGASAAVAR